MKKIISWVLAIAITWTSIAIFPVQVQAHWADSYIEKWKTYGILDEINTQNPDRLLNKEEVEILLGRFEGVEKVDIGDITLTREAIIYRLMKEFDFPESRTINEARQFKDFNQISGEYRLFIEGAIEGGLIISTKENFNPKASISLAEFIILINNIADQTINKEGQYSYYGQNEDMKMKSFNNLIITSDYVTLNNANIRGNLYIAEGVGHGGVTLVDTEIGGKMIVLGGGDSIRFENSKVKELVIKQDDYAVNLISDGGSIIDNTKIKSDVKIRELFPTELGFVNLEIGDIEVFAKVEVDGEFENVYVNDQSIINIIGETKINNLKFISKAKESIIRTSEESKIDRIVTNNMTLPENIGELYEINITDSRERTVVKGHVKRINVTVPSFVDIQKDAVVDELIVGNEAGGTNIYLDYNSKIKIFKTNTIVKVLGDGEVEIAKINSNGVELNKSIKELELGKGIKSVEIGNKTVREDFEAPEAKTLWDNYIIRTKLTNLISIPSNESIKLIVRPKDRLEKAEEEMLTWSIKNGPGIKYAYINPYTGIIEAQGDGKIIVTAFDSEFPEKSIKQEIYVGNPNKWFKYPYRDYNMYTGIEITCPKDEDLDRLREGKDYKLKAKLLPKYIEDGEIEWSISSNTYDDIDARITEDGELIIEDGSDSGELWVMAKLEDASYDLIAQREFYVKRRYDDDLLDSVDFTLETEKMPKDGTMKFTPIIKVDDNRNEDEDKDEFEWKVEILDGRFNEYPSIYNNTLRAYGQGRVIVTLQTTDGSNLFAQKIIEVENIDYTDIVIQDQKEYEFDNEYYEDENGIEISSESQKYSIQEIAGQLRMEVKSTEHKTLDEITWGVSQIDGDIWQMSIDETTGLLSVSGNGRILVTAEALALGVKVSASKVITVGSIEYQDEKPTIFLNLYIEDEDEDEIIIKQNKKYTLKIEDDYDEEYNERDLEWTIIEKEDTIKKVTLTNRGKIEVNGYGKITVQIYGMNSDETEWLIGYKEIEIEKTRHDD